MSRKMLFVDHEKCTGCRMCEAICSLEHEGFCAPGHARVRVIKDEEEGLDFPLVCRHCNDSPCKNACPSGALYLDPGTSVVLWDKEKCIGCGLCFAACPVGAIFFDPPGEKILKCDLCGGDPQCARFCEPQAIQFMDKSEAYLAMGMRMSRIYSGLSPRKRLEPKIAGELKV